MYSGRVCLGDLSEQVGVLFVTTILFSLFIQVTLDLLGLANKYDFCTLQHAIMSFLKATLTIANVCHIFNVALFYQLKELSQACTSFVDMNASQVLLHILLLTNMTVDDCMYMMIVFYSHR